MGEKDDRFYFDADIAEPLVLVKKKLRSGLEYDADASPEKTALKCLKQISERFDGNVYLLTASQASGSRSKIRIKKGLFWGEKELRNLPARHWEVDVADGVSRIVSLVDLKGFSFDEGEGILLNWVFSLIVLSPLDIDALGDHVKEWIATGSESILAYDYSAVAKSLAFLDSVAALRYFPADNGRRETLLAVGNRSFVDKTVLKCLDT
jgi:hypothetical protein